MSIIFDWFTNNTGKRGLSPDPSYPGDMVQSDLDEHDEKCGWCKRPMVDGRCGCDGE